MKKGVAVLLQLTKFEQTPLMRLLLPLAAGMAVAAACHGETRAAAARAVYVLSDNDGYGLNDCISQQRECGKIVADSWCEAHGHGRALAFGGAEDVTGAVGIKPAPAAGAAVVSCAE